ncbi:putative bifunctional diguanylate cyclase/phosphodiesterase [Novosphingobium colocasiae]|uniref:putative bifunctional diguanylate cyclase/phosphodiesterase n=1 Tax=Novosphingobium colocasiae TaxID=1256513 RepID=UPI0035B48190
MNDGEINAINRLPIGQHPLPIAQYLRLRDHVPPLYGLLCINAAILAYTHRDLAPIGLTLGVPVVLAILCAARIVAWLRPVAPEALTVEIARTRLRRTIGLAFLLSVSFVSWAMILDSYGGAYEHGHVAIFIAVTLLGCIFCLSYLPTAAITACVTAIGAYMVHCIISGSEVMIAIAVNIALVAMMMVRILRNSYAGFVNLEVAQRELMGERRQAQALGEENARLAQTDALTSLPNRRFFFAMLEGLLQKSPRADQFCVGLIDLDRFKPINDTHGHACGDQLLRTIGQRMLDCCPENAVVARLGGDEFGLIVLGGPQEAEAVAQALCDVIRQPARLGDVTVAVGCSAGLSVHPDTGTTANLLFDRADFALYHAKNHKRGQCVRFSSELEGLIRSEQALDAALQAADIATELTLAYQPIVSIQTLETVGMECLARWNSPRLGVVSPEALIATAERIGRSREVTLALFDKALVALAALPAPLRATFNLSGTDLGDEETISALLQRITASGLDPRRLLFEITESSLIAEIDLACAALGRLRATGVRIALDDFGTGYSSLSSLHQLPLDMVKIDRSFALRLDDAAGRRLITAIRNLVRSLSLDCVIEGIETESQLFGARLAGFTLAQGYFIARPMPLAAVLDLDLGSEPSVWTAA